MKYTVIMYNLTGSLSAYFETNNVELAQAVHDDLKANHPGFKVQIKIAP